MWVSEFVSLSAIFNYAEIVLDYARAGPMGIFTVSLLAALGARCLDLSSRRAATNSAHTSQNSLIIVSEPVKERREIALSAGATHVIDPTQEDAVARVRSLTEGNGTDLSFECAGVQRSLETGIASLKPTGRAVNLAMWNMKVRLLARQRYIRRLCS